MNKRVVITGAGAGIGRALSEFYLKKGDRVIALDIHTEVLADFSGRVYQVDVSRGEELQAIAHRLVEEEGTPDIWINCAGIAKLGSFDQMESDAFNQVMSVNFTGTVNGTRTALSLMKNGVGSIVNIASLSGFLPAPFMSAYSASKHAVTGFTRSVRMELDWSGSKIKMILVLPGFVRTHMIESQPGFQLPSWMDFMVSTPELTASRIYQGIERGKKDIYPDASAKTLLNIYRLMPECSSPLSRLALAKNWRQWVGLEEITRGK